VLDGTSVARIRVVCRQVTPGIPDHLCGKWVVDTWPLIHGGCYHVTEVGGPYGL
jgi:hypothetical protein